MTLFKAELLHCHWDNHLGLWIAKASMAFYLAFTRLAKVCQSGQLERLSERPCKSLIGGLW